VRKLINQAENLQLALGLQVAPLIQPQAGYMSVDVPRKVRIPLTLGEVWRQGQYHCPDSKVAFPLGMAIDGTIVWVDLSDPTLTSILVSGTSGSGKSVCLRTAVIGMRYTPLPLRSSSP
jgi:S-DNA-T family DNA segregation ATPase FtsK/SpoIIIE